jgi:hypothetical protein
MRSRSWWPNPAAVARPPRTAVWALLTVLAAPMAYAEDPGTIVGVVRNAAHTPVADATVTAVHAGDHAIRATVSHTDGEYAFADLPPGNW